MIQPKRCQLRQHLWACARQWDRGQNPSVLPRSEKIPECAPCSLPGLGCLLPAVRLSSLCASRLSRPHLCPSIHKWHQVQSHARWSRVCVWSAASPQSTVSVSDVCSGHPHFPCGDGSDAGENMPVPADGVPDALPAGASPWHASY